ncbi:MAG: hypothetical protein QOJ54_2357 [Aliidongia sp.]|jgi:hypothetical protein|nr:hypothetical protein [Aliidongia sp.]
MTEISGSFFSPFPATGELGLSLISILGSSNNGNAASILASGNSDTFGPLDIISASNAAVSSSPTINALSAGELSTVDHNVIASIGQTAGNSLLIPWNANGTAPTTVTNLQNLHWIKLLSVETPAGAPAPTGATYGLTPVGQAIFKRTVSTTLGPGTQSTIGNASAPSAADAAALAGLSSQVSTLIGALSSVGVNVKA